MQLQFFILSCNAFLSKRLGYTEKAIDIASSYFVSFIIYLDNCLNIFIDFQCIPNGTEIKRCVLLFFEANWERNWAGGKFQQRQNFKPKRMNKISFKALLT